MKSAGTHEALPDFLADMEEDLKQGLLPAQIYNNQRVYELEKRRIFARCWVYIGHETEIPDPGDYAVRMIGEDPFIFVRDDEGVIRVLFNGCRHRGGRVCLDDMGNAKAFVCPLHGWSYRNSGQLDGVPAKNEGYRKLDLAKWGLIPAPHVASYHGLVFASLDPEAAPLAQYLGKFRWYLDIQLLLTRGGMEVLGEPHRWVVNANWKSGAENFTGDSSHTPMTHRSILSLKIVNPAVANAPNKKHGLHVHDCDGHAISIRQLEPGQSAFWDYPEEVTRHIGTHHLNEAQVDLARRGLVHDGTVFPNFSFIHLGLSDSEEKPPAGFLSIRVWQPKGPGKMEIWSWILAPKEAPESYKRRAYQVAMSSFSPSGSFEQDDVVLWPMIARTAATVFADKVGMKFNFQMGLDDMGSVPPLTDFPGPGVAVPTSVGECGPRTFHDSWYAWMKKEEKQP
ncbi:MAG: ring-hydroxylating oxygenase subunit alpha [Betaproteobacteria bacterium]|nr:ring-hydroxylating oxygenase subunit alpha [Betaproteobacteria bacterium]